MTSRTRIVATLLALVAAVAAPSLGKSQANLQQSLDRQVELELDNARIGDLFESLQQAAGVEFVLDRKALDALPYGEETRLDVKIKNITLRKALSPILARQGLRWTVEGEKVRILPSEALARMCRRATFEELDTLGKLHTVQLKATSEAGPVIQQLRKLQGQDDLKLLMHVESDAKDHSRADRVLPGTGARWLDMFCHSKNWTWYVWGDRIIVLDKATQVRRQLEKQVTVSYQNAELVKILLDLSQASGVRLSLTPGVINYLPEAQRTNFNLTMGDASVEQALQVISGATGLEFAKTADGVLVQASEQLKAKGQGFHKRPPRPRFFVRFEVEGPEGADIEVFMRPDELPEDVVKMIEKATDEFVAKLRSGQAPDKQQ